MKVSNSDKELECLKKALAETQKILNAQVELNNKLLDSTPVFTRIMIDLINSIAGVRHGFDGDDEVQAFVDQLTENAVKEAYNWLANERNIKLKNLR